MALSGDRATDYREGVEKDYPVAASTKIYSGSLVAVNASGYAVPAADTAGLAVVGVAMARADNSAGAAGDISVVVRARGEFRFKGSGLSQALVGQNVCAVDDETVAGAATTTNDVVVGKLSKYLSATDGWVAIG